MKDQIKVWNSCEIRNPWIVPTAEAPIRQKICSIDLIPSIAIHVRETESGSLKEGDPPYPFSHTVSMQFKGTVVNSTSIYQIIPKLPESLRARVMKEGSMNLKEECTLIAELAPDEKNMKAEQWHCSDPVNNTPPPAMLGVHPAEFTVPTRIWQIGQKIYISHGFLDGIHGYFPSWEDPRSLNKKRALRSPV